MIEWKLEKRLLKDLKPHPKNPRLLTKTEAHHLKTSLSKFGVAEKPIITQHNHIIGGHQRIKILKDMGITEIDCWIPSKDLSQEEIDEFLIRLNKNTGEWDWDLMANEWDLNSLCEWGFESEDFFGKEFVSEKEDKPKKEKEIKKCPHCGGDLNG